MATKDMFRECRKLGRRALTAKNSDEVLSAIGVITKALRSKNIVGKRARSLRATRRALRQKLMFVA